MCQVTTNAKGLVTSQSPVPISGGSAPTVQVNGNSMGTASTINFGSGSGFTFSGSVSAGVATITGSASSGSGGSMTTGSGTPSSGCSSSSNLGALYLQTNTSAATLWVCGYNGSSYHWVQVQDNKINIVSLGADPTGSSDSTSAINSAVGASCPTACVIYFPPGKYKTSSTVVVANSNTTLTGAGGKGVSVLDFEPSTAGTALLVSSANPSTTDIARVSIRNLGIYSSNASVKKIALQMPSVHRLHV